MSKISVIQEKIVKVSEINFNKLRKFETTTKCYLKKCKT